MSDYLLQRLNVFEQSDEEEQEVYLYANDHDLELWSPRLLELCCCMNNGQKEYSIPNPLIVPSVNPVLGILTHASFLNRRPPGWEERDLLQARHTDEITQRTHGKELATITRAARQQWEAEYKERAVGLLKGDTELIDQWHIPALVTRVRELREQLEQEAELLRDRHGQLLSDWFQAAFVIQGGKSDPPEEKPTGSRMRLGTFYGRVWEGLPPASTLFEAEQVFRNASDTPEAVTKAQLAGLTYLLLERERILQHAVKVRDKLAIYEPLLSCAVFDMPPLSPEAKEALAEKPVDAEMYATLLNGTKRLRYIDEVMIPKHHNAGGWPAISREFISEWEGAGLPYDDLPWDHANPDVMNRKHWEYRKRLEARRRRARKGSE